MKVEISSFKTTAWRDSKEKNAQVFEQWRREFNLAELLTVSNKLRDCATYHVDSENFQEEVSKLNQMGLVFWPIKKVKRFSGFAHKFYEPVPGQPYTIYGVVSCSFEKAQEFVLASQKDSPDHMKIGELLGYPSCCLKFFDRFWVKGEFDPIFSEAERSKGAKTKIGLTPNIKGIPSPMVKAKIVTLKAFPEVNIALRYFGPRAVPHLPCSFTCEKSRELSKKFLKFMPSKADLLSFLAEPMVWDGYKGAAVINTKWFQGAVNSVSWEDDCHRIVNFI
ncbi:MAG: hypothetical protein Q7K28_01230 [Candidatus Wildermuthbacteria bacterium]|nr:hypothetical protein [Candidatus Wildermuthbacteria bacterium]